jgi:hypothetical protein
MQVFNKDKRSRMYYIRHRNTEFWRRRTPPSIRPETIFAAPNGNRLTCNNSGLNTGAQLAPLGSRRDDTTHNEPMGSVDGQDQRQDDDQEGRPQGRPQGENEWRGARPGNAQFKEAAG